MRNDDEKTINEDGVKPVVRRRVVPASQQGVRPENRQERDAENAEPQMTRVRRRIAPPDEQLMKWNSAPSAAGEARPYGAGAPEEQRTSVRSKRIVSAPEEPAGTQAARPAVRKAVPASSTVRPPVRRAGVGGTEPPTEEKPPVFMAQAPGEPQAPEKPPVYMAQMPDAPQQEEPEIFSALPQRGEAASPARVKFGKVDLDAEEGVRVRPAREAVRRVARTSPEKRERVASDYAGADADHPPVNVAERAKGHGLPDASFGARRAYKPIVHSSAEQPEYVAAAGKLRFRNELKYYINYRDYIVLRQALKNLLSPDENGDANNSYHIRSLYFDDRDETALIDKEAGVYERAKYRIRIYNFSDKVIRFEKKLKVGSYIAKSSMKLSRREYNAILQGDIGFLLRRGEPLARELFLQFRQRQLAPRVVVDYMREAYIMPYEDVRITFDKNLKSGKLIGSLFDKNLPVIPIAEPDTMILEVKFNKYLPDYVKAVLNELKSPQVSAISKYVHCRKYD